MKRMIVLVCCLLFAWSADAAEWHVTIDGSPDGAGTAESPWDLETALAQPAAVRPGDVIWVHGGQYLPSQGNYFHVVLVGTAEAAVIVRNYKDQRATLRAPLDVGNQSGDPRYVWLWGLEVQTRGAAGGNPVNIGNSAKAPGTHPGIKLINCVLHDCPHNGLGCWASAEEEVHGCIVYHNGSDGGSRGHGHGFYIQSHTRKEFRNNIVFRNFFLGFQVYGSQPPFENITMEGNTFFNSGEISVMTGGKKVFPMMHIQGGQVARNTRFIDNCFYVPAWAVKGTSSMGNTENALLKGNYFVAPGPDRRVALDLETLGENRNLTMTDNTLIGMIVGFTPDQYGTGNVHLTERPTSGSKVFIRPNGYEKGRANITIYNWQKAPTVAVDISAAGLAKGEGFEIRDVQNWYGKPIVTGSYSGEPVMIPMTGLAVAAPIGLDPNKYPTPPHTAPEFGAFVVLKRAP